MGRKGGETCTKRTKRKRGHNEIGRENTEKDERWAEKTEKGKRILIQKKDRKLEGDREKEKRVTEIEKKEKEGRKEKRENRKEKLQKR